MAEIYVQSSAALDGVIEQLDRLRVLFGERANAINDEQEALVSKWQGDASEAFNQHWMQERDNFSRLYDVIVQYVEALRAIKTRYEDAENTNKAIAEG